MRITLFRIIDEKRLPPHVIGRARPKTWAEGVSHVALAQDEAKKMNGCDPRWHFEASTFSEVKESLSRVALEPTGFWDLREKKKPKRKYRKRKIQVEEQVLPQDDALDAVPDTKD